MTDADPFAAVAVANPDQAEDPFAAVAVDESAAPITAPPGPQQQAMDWSRSRPPVEFEITTPSEISGPEDDQQAQANDFVADAFRRATHGDPTHDLEAADISEATGVEPSLIKTQLDRFRTGAKLAQENPRRWVQQNPDLFELMLLMPHVGPTVVRERDAFKKVSRQDFDAYASEHPWMAAFGSIAEGKPGETIKTKETVEMADLSHLNPVYVAGEAFARSVADNTEGKREYFRMHAEFQDYDSDTSRAMREARVSRRIDRGLDPYYGEGLANRAAATIAGAVGAGADSAGALSLGAIIGIFTKPQVGMTVAKIAGAATSFVTETGSYWGDTDDARDDKGNPIDRNIRFATANLYGALASGVEVLTLGAQGAGISALSAKRWAKSMMTDGTKRGALLEFAKTLGRDAASEGGEGGAQQALGLTIQWLAKNVSAGEIQKFDLVQAEAETGSAAVQEGLAGIFGIGGVTGLTNTATALMGLRDSARSGARLAAINEVAKTKAAQAAPRQVADLISAQGQEDGRRVTRLYIDPTKFHEFAKNGGVDVNDVATELMGPDGPRRLQDALDVRGDAPGARATLEVTLAEYLEKIGPKPIAEALAEDMATAPGRLTLREQRLFQHGVQARADEIAKLEPIDSPEAAAVGSIEEQLVTAGRPQREARLEASVAYAMAESLARQSGRTTDDVLTEMFHITGVGIERPQQANVETLKQPSLESMAAELRPASADTLRQDFQALAPGEQRQRYFRDRNTGLKNFRALETAWKDPSRQHLALFSLEGAKFLNDNFGHGSVDGALRRMADAVREVAPEAGAKVGGDIGVLVRDDAQAQEILEAMKRALPSEIQVTYDIGARQESLKHTITAVADSHKAKRLAAEQGGTLAKRGDAPVGLVPGDAATMAGLLTAVPESTAQTAIAAQHEAAFTADATAFETAHLDASGLLSDDGFAAARKNPKTRKAFVMSADLRGFAGMNAAFGRDATDAIKAFFNKQLFERGAGAFDTANRHGDEYAAQGDDDTEMGEWFSKAQDAMRRVVLWDHNADGSISYQPGVHFAYGIDSDEDIADRVKLKEAKQQQDAAGTVRGVGRVESEAELDERLREYARAGNLDGVIKRRVGDLVQESGADGRGVPSGPRSQADQVADAAVERLKQRDGEGDSSPRGWIDIARKGAKKQLQIFLTKNADASTFPHESAHAYFVMLGDMAAAPDATDGIKKDWDTARKWAGAKDGEPLTEQQQEKLARGFEAYLIEGKAPSSALAEVFASFRRWLLGIYKTATALGVELNDEIRGVFDRMLATDQEIDRARTASGVDKAVFSTPEEAGVAPKDFDAYLASRVRVRSDVIAHTQRMIHEGELRAAKAFRTEEFRRLRDQLEEEWASLPQTKAWRYVKNGEVVLPDGTVDADAERGKLDRDEVVELLGKAHPLIKRLTGRLVKSGGESPIDVAERFGFADTKDMLEKLTDLPSRDAFAKAEAERAMKDKHPEIDGEIADLQAAIQKLLHADSYDAAERDWQLIKARTTDPITIEALQRSAKEKVADQTAGRLDPGVVLNRERSYATQMAQAVAEGNFERAMAFAHRRLLHKYIWRELVEAKDMRESFVDLVGDMLTEKSRKRLGLVSLEHRDVVDALLEAIAATPERDTEMPRKGLDALIARMESDGDSVAFDADFIGKLIWEPRGWKSLKVSELQAVLDALNNIKASARNGETLLMDGRRVERDTFIGEFLAAGADIEGTRAQLSTKDAGTIAENVSMSVDRFKLTNLRPETMLEKFGEPGRAIVKMLQDAKHKKSDILAQTVKPISDVFDNIPKSVRSRFQEGIDGGALFPDYHDKALVPRRRYELITLAFNSGAVENINNLREGNGISDAQRREALSLLTKEELDFVQTGWDAMESTWPLVRDLEERYSGVAPPRVERVPMTITTSDGHTVHLRGGYFPIVHDNRGDTGFGQRAEIKNAAEVLDVSLARPGTSRSHTNRRTGAIEAVSLEPSTFQLHIARVANDLAYREPLRAAVNILLHKDVKSMLRTKLGKDAPSVFESWLRNIGQSVAAQAVLSDSWLWSSRSKLPRAVLGFNIANLLGDLTGIVTPLIGTSVSKRHWVAAMMRYWLGLRMQSTREFALSKSGELRSRWSGDEAYQGFQNRTRSLTQSRHQRFVSAIAEHAFFFHEQLEKAVITPLWDARYRQALDEGSSDQDAVSIANALVRQEFPAKSVVDKASIQTDKGVLGFMAMFSGFPNWVFNKYYRFWEPVGRAKGPKAKAFAATRALLAHVAFATVVGPLGELLVGRGPPPGDDDDAWERWGEWYVRKMVTAHLMPIPLVGGFIESVIDRRASTRFPALAAAEATVKAAQKIYAVATDDDNVDPEDAVLAAMRAYGFLTGAPTNAIARSLEYLLEGDYSNSGGVPAGLLYGDRKNKQGESVQPLNPISIFDQ